MILLNEKDHTGNLIEISVVPLSAAIMLSQVVPQATNHGQ